LPALHADVDLLPPSSPAQKLWLPGLWSTPAQGALLDAVCELSPAAIVCEDSDSQITRWDGAAERLTGISAAEVVGRKTSEFLRLADRAEGVGLIELAAGGMDEDEPALLRTSAGTPLEVLLNIREFGDGSTIVTGAVARIAPM